MIANVYSVIMIELCKVRNHSLNQKLEVILGIKMDEERLFQVLEEIKSKLDSIADRIEEDSGYV